MPGEVYCLCQKSDAIPIEPRSLDIRLGCNYNICTWYVVVYDLFKPFKPYLRTIDFINMYSHVSKESIYRKKVEG